MTAVRDRVRAILTTRLAIDVPDSDAEPIGDGRLDSLLLMELLYEIELEFGTRADFGDFEPERLESVGGMVAWIEQDLVARRP
jgi:acyl carrier protein